MEFLVQSLIGIRRSSRTFPQSVATMLLAHLLLQCVQCVRVAVRRPFLPTPLNSRRFTNHAGWWSSPPRDATMTNDVPDWYGEVNITSRGCPDWRPVVVSFRTGILPAFQPFFPRETTRMVLWTKFMVLRVRSLGINRQYRASPCDKRFRL